MHAEGQHERRTTGACIREDAASCRSAVMLALVALGVSFVIALVPVSLDLSISEDSLALSETWQKLGVEVHGSQAFANPVVTTYGSALLSEFAAAAGLTETQFVTTVAGMVTVGTGMNMGRNAGVKYGNDLGSNLENIINAADYPDWDTLSNEQQANYGSKQNYDSVKFNELMRGFGYADVIDGFYESNGGNFEVSEDLNDRLSQIGRIGRNWATGWGATFGSIVDALTNKNAIMDLLGVEQSLEFDATDNAQWPSSISRHIYLTYGTQVNVRYIQNGNVRYSAYGSNTPVYYWVSSKSGSTNYTVYMFSKDAYAYGSYAYSASNNSVNASTWPSRNDGSIGVYYFTGSTMFSTGNQETRDFPVNSEVTGSWNDVYKAVQIMLYGEGMNYSGEPNVPDYPGSDDIPEDQQIYFPTPGVNNTTNWNYYITEPDRPRPENTFNPGNETSSEQWQHDTADNIKPILAIDFNKLFPFCLLYDIGLLFDKMVSLGVVAPGSETGSGITTQGFQDLNYLELRIPLQVDGGGVFGEEGMDDEIVLDLTPIHDFLLIVRPIVQVLLIAALLGVVIDFWKGVLAG